VAEVSGHAINGLLAWLLWHGYYLSKIPAWRNRVHLILSWGLAGLTGRATAQLRLEPSAAAVADSRHIDRETGPLIDVRG
jgi:hypothetical protein